MKKFVLIITTLLFIQIDEKKVDNFGVCNPEKSLENNVISGKKEKISANIKNYDPNDKIIIIGLENVSQDRLLEAEKVLKRFYRFKTRVINTRYAIYERFYYNDERKIIDPDMLVRAAAKEFETTDKILFITNKEMYANNTFCRGYTTVEGRVLISKDDSFMEETIIHEVGHTYGLLHCNDLKCVMAIYNDEFDEGKFCDICRRQINYY